jgi:hypothetical protein
MKVIERERLTDPMARKNENVAALLSMYCESVARNPRGPAPPLSFQVQAKIQTRGRMSGDLDGRTMKQGNENQPDDSPRTKNKSNRQPNTTTHQSTHPGTLTPR